MMLFNLSAKNIKKSYKDYAIYFITLILGVAIFYVFNSLDSQQAMEEMGSSTYQIIDLMIKMLSGMSVFVSCILGFLIVYANNFLIKRRKREFGIYMTLGMGKGQISRILLGETAIIGMISLAAGLILGIFGAQFMSLLVVKMFGGVMDRYQFVFSKSAFWKSILYFGIIFVIVAIFNLVSISRLQLIQLLAARKKNEQVKMKNPVICFMVFLLAAADLAMQYYLVCHPQYLHPEQIGGVILAGCVGTFLFFWSLSGFMLNIMQKRKTYYLRDLNAFVLRQMHSKINTMVFAMTVICIMLFLTISILAGGLGLNYNFQKMLHELTPVDVNIYSQRQDESKDGSIQQTDAVIDKSCFKDWVHVNVYRTPQLTMAQTLGTDFADMEEGMLLWDPAIMTEDIMKVSDYNKIAEFYGEKTIEVPEGSYAVVCDYESMKKIRNQALKAGQTIVLDGEEYVPVSESCRYGFLEMIANHANAGIIILPDNSVKEEWKYQDFLAANYKGTTKQDKETAEKQVRQYEEQGFFINSKIEIVETSSGLSTTVTFVAIYLGIIFLISSAAILALKELSESSDNRERYDMIRKIGADEKMISRALFQQISSFFFLPLFLAVIHSVFGLAFIGKILEVMGKIESISSILATAGILLVVYGGYFLITYLGSKRMIQNKIL